MSVKLEQNHGLAIGCNTEVNITFKIPGGHRFIETTIAWIVIDTAPYSALRRISKDDYARISQGRMWVHPSHHCSHDIMSCIVSVAFVSAKYNF